MECWHEFILTAITEEMKENEKLPQETVAISRFRNCGDKDNYGDLMLIHSRLNLYSRFFCIMANPVKK